MRLYQKHLCHESFNLLYCMRSVVCEQFNVMLKVWNAFNYCTDFKASDLSPCPFFRPASAAIQNGIGATQRISQRHVSIHPFINHASESANAVREPQ